MLLKRNSSLFFLPLIVVILAACSHTPTIDKPLFADLKAGQPTNPETIKKIHDESPKDAVFADLLQAFALMRKGNIKDARVRKEIEGLLETSVTAFEDLSGKSNFFSDDEGKNYRGSAYERMYASLMAGVFHMAEGDCGRAMPYFRNAEFGARFQKLPFGLDTPLIPTLMYRCLNQQKAPQDEIEHAKNDVHHAVRFLTLQTPLVKALVDMSEADTRHLAIAKRLAYMTYEISIYHSLISAKRTASVVELLDDAAKNAELFISSIDDNFKAELDSTLGPSMKEVAKVYGLSESKGSQYLKDLSLNQVHHEIIDIGKKMKLIISELPEYRDAMNKAVSTTDRLFHEIIDLSSAKNMVLAFDGVGPTIERKGSYQEIAVIKPSPTGTVEPEIRHKKITTPTTCGFHRTKNEGFSVVLCGDENKGNLRPISIEALELLSLSRKATTIAGRKFDEVLRGRARFRAATENVAEISAWSALFLFYMGTAIIDNCNRRGQSEACYAPGLALYAIGGITIVFSGTIWLIGRTANPATDSRFNHLMYESAWLGRP